MFSIVRLRKMFSVYMALFTLLTFSISASADVLAQGLLEIYRPYEGGYLVGTNIPFSGKIGTTFFRQGDLTISQTVNTASYVGYIPNGTLDVTPVKSGGSENFTWAVGDGSTRNYATRTIAGNKVFSTVGQYRASVYATYKIWPGLARQLPRKIGTIQNNGFVIYRG